MLEAYSDDDGDIVRSINVATWNDACLTDISATTRFFFPAIDSATGIISARYMGQFRRCQTLEDACQSNKLLLGDNGLRQ